MVLGKTLPRRMTKCTNIPREQLCRYAFHAQFGLHQNNTQGFRIHEKQSVPYRFRFTFAIVLVEAVDIGFGAICAEFLKPRQQLNFLEPAIVWP